MIYDKMNTNGGILMNETIKLLKHHRSFREFDQNYLLSDEQLQVIIDAARQAPSWMNGQFYSIIILKDPKLREKLVAWNPGNPHILKSSVFLLFVGDLYRTEKVSQSYQTEYFVDQSVEPLLISTADSALAMGNAAIAAESLGLGTVVVGSIRNHSKEIIELLDLPKNTFPLFGLSIGKPIVEMVVKPRLPEQAVVHMNKFQPYSYCLIEQYDQVMEQFGEARETKKWSQKFSDYFSQEPPFITDRVLQMQGFLTKFNLE